MIILEMKFLITFYNKRDSRHEEAVVNSFRQNVKFISFRHKLLYDAEA
ncbi:hypothetical protein MetMK1DRAFT_00008190 [Metallosphaera yellowstonensis MK1]|jgi:hypothetical protein|uniref:Uncharacterized protein n=1 Tax=Metallosphaera yellowstonensis MK1 TaxID=671065 RepID=H2C246_9CREN|nr:hypothetical protein MetMK1DRAFT_00008190 [Metallosphaera yellowstonensis MK1]